MALEFLNSPQGEEQAAAPEAVVEPVAEPAQQAEAQPDDQPRGADGKFAPKDPATPPAPEPELAQEPQAAPLAEAAVPPGFVPLTALQEVRSELQALKAAQERPTRPAQPQYAQQPPDRYEDPEGYEAYRDQQLDERLFTERLNVSERFARTQHGDELVTEAQQWALKKFEADPLFYQRLRQQPDPYGFAVSEYRKDKLFTEFKDDDFAAFQAWKASQVQAAPTPAVAAPVASAAPLTPPPQAPPRSIAGAPSAGGPASVPIGPGQAFDGVFSKG